MANNANSADTEQWRSAVFAIVEALLEFLKGFAGEQSTGLGGDGAGEGCAEHLADQARQALRGLERDITNKAVADHHIGVPVEYLSSLDVTDEVDRQLLEQAVGFACELVALVFFFTNGEKADSGTGDLEHAAGVHLAHDGELLQVMRLALDVCPNVEQNAGRTGGGWHDAGQRRTVDP